MKTCVQSLEVVANFLCTCLLNWLIPRIVGLVETDSMCWRLTMIWKAAREGISITAAQTKYTDCVYDNIKTQNIYKGDNTNEERQTVGHVV